MSAAFGLSNRRPCPAPAGVRPPPGRSRWNELHMHDFDRIGYDGSHPLFDRRGIAPRSTPVSRRAARFETSRSCINLARGNNVPADAGTALEMELIGTVAISGRIDRVPSNRPTIQSNRHRERNDSMRLTLTNKEKVVSWRTVWSSGATELSAMRPRHAGDGRHRRVRQRARAAHFRMSGLRLGDVSSRYRAVSNVGSGFLLIRNEARSVGSPALSRAAARAACASPYTGGSRSCIRAACRHRCGASPVGR